MQRRVPRSLCRFVLLAASTAVSLFGCRAVEEFLHMEPVAVVDYYPHAEHVGGDSVEVVWVKFSAGMATVQTEDACGVSQDGVPVDGRYRWDMGGRRLLFHPANPLRRGHGYVLRVSTEAEDRFGNSLSGEFVSAFRIGSESRPPKLLGHSPGDAAAIADARAPIVLRFSEAMDRQSLYSGFSLRPDVTGMYFWEDDDTTVSIVPVTHYVPGVDYVARLDSTITDRSGNGLAFPVTFTFRLIAEEPLEVVRVARLSDGAELVDESVAFLNSIDVEKDDAFLVSFSTRVPLERRGGIIALDGAAAPQVTFDDDGRTATVSVSEPMLWMQLYHLAVHDKSYRFRITGEASRPPEVVDAYYTPSAGAPVLGPLALGDNVDFVPSTDAAVDLVISHSSEAELLRSAAMEAVSIETSYGSPIRFSVQNLYFSASHPLGGILPSGRTVCRLRLRVEPDAPGMAIVTVAVDEDLCDSRGNHLQSDWALEVNGY